MRTTKHMAPSAGAEEEVSRNDEDNVKCMLLIPCSDIDMAANISSLLCYCRVVHMCITGVDTESMAESIGEQYADCITIVDHAQIERWLTRAHAEGDE